MESDQEPTVERLEDQSPASAEPAADNQPERSQPDEGQNAGQIQITDRRRFTPTGEPVAGGEVVAKEGGRSEQVGEAPEGPEGPEGMEELRARLREAESKRAEAERQVSDYAGRFRQAQAQLRAENDELRARWQRSFEQKLEAARGDLVVSLLDVLDNLKRAVAAAEASEERGPEFDSLLGGVRATAELFEARMRQLGLASVPSEGEPFDPEVHEAVETVPVAPEQDQRVIAELQPGYKFGDRLLRPARVRVGRASD
jgi:molecular chaperone GrpE